MTINNIDQIWNIFLGSGTYQARGGKPAQFLLELVVLSVF